MMYTPKRTMLFAFLLAIVAFGLETAPAAEEWKAPPEAAQVKNPVPKSKESIARGKKLYMRYCMNCHGVSGKGDGPEAAGLDPPPGNFTNSQKMSAETDGELFWKITNGKGKMKPYAEVSSTHTDQEKWDLVNYIRTFAGESKKAGSEGGKEGKSTAVAMTNELKVGDDVVIPPVKEFRLTAQEKTLDLLSGVAVKAWTYNGQVPGPEIRVKEGQRVRVILENKLPEPTTIHWHGMIVPASMDGVPGVSMEAIKPGQSFTYEFVAARPGTFWYHPHVDSVSQISRGMYGAFIVEPRKQNLKIDQDYTLLMSEWTVPSKSESAEIMKGSGGMGGMGAANYYTINGKSAPAIPSMKVKKGERILIRFINAGNEVHPMHLHGHAFQVVATDGYRLPSPYQKDTLPINAGERYDVIVTADNPGTWAFHCHDLHHVTNDGKYPGGLLLLFQYE